MSSSTSTETAPASMKAKLLGAWLFVGIPLSYGIIQTVRRAAALFTG